MRVEFFDGIVVEDFASHSFGEIRAPHPVEDVEDDEGEGEEEARGIIHDGHATVRAKLRPRLIQMMPAYARTLRPG